MYVVLISSLLIVLPELAASDHLFRFWKSVAVKDDVSVTCTCFCTSYENLFYRICVLVAASL